MEHRGDGHIDIINAHPSLSCRTRQPNRDAQSMQHNLALTEINPFGISCRSRRIKGCRPNIFAEVRRIETGRRAVQQVFILAVKRNSGCSVPLSTSIAKTDNLLDCRGFSLEAFEQRSKVIMDQQCGIGRMVNGVENLLRRQPDVDRVQHSADHRDREKTLQVSMSVPIHHRDRVARTYSQTLKSARQALNPIEEFTVSKAQITDGDDLLPRMLGGQP